MAQAFIGVCQNRCFESVFVLFMRYVCSFHSCANEYIVGICDRCPVERQKNKINHNTESKRQTTYCRRGGEGGGRKDKKKKKIWINIMLVRTYMVRTHNNVFCFCCFLCFRFLICIVVQQQQQNHNSKLWGLKRQGKDNQLEQFFFGFCSLSEWKGRARFSHVITNLCHLRKW